MPLTQANSTNAADGPSDRALVIGLGLAHFLLLASHYLMRPVRDEVAANLRAVDSDIGIGDLWMAVFFVNLALTPVYAAFARSSSRRRLLCGLVLFFALNAAIFSEVFASTSGTTRLWADRAFYVWASVFVMFALSSFWSFASDLCSLERAKRLFGPIAAAGTTGQIAGATVTREMSESNLGASAILLVAVVTLCLAALVLYLVDRRATPVGPTDAGAPESTRIGGSIWSGLVAVVRSPYLLAITGFLLLMTMSSSVAYYVQSDAVSAAFDERAARREWLAGLDVWVGWIALALQAGVVGAIMRRAGLGVALVALPVIAIACALTFGLTLPTSTNETALATAASTSLGVLGVALVAQRIARYAFAKPARETLFTLVTRDERYKSKSFMDTAVYRGSDVLWARVAEGLMRGGQGISIGTLALVSVPLLVVWSVLAWFLGRHAQGRKRVNSHPRRASTGGPT